MSDLGDPCATTTNSSHQRVDEEARAAGCHGDWSGEIGAVATRRHDAVTAGVENGVPLAVRRRQPAPQAEHFSSQPKAERQVTVTHAEALTTKETLADADAETETRAKSMRRLYGSRTPASDDGRCSFTGTA